MIIKRNHAEAVELYLESQYYRHRAKERQREAMHDDPPGAPWWLPVMLIASIPGWILARWILSLF